MADGKIDHRTVLIIDIQLPEIGSITDTDPITYFITADLKRLGGAKDIVRIVVSIYIDLFRGVVVDIGSNSVFAVESGGSRGRDHLDVIGTSIISVITISGEVEQTAAETFLIGSQREGFDLNQFTGGIQLTDGNRQRSFALIVADGKIDHRTVNIIDIKLNVVSLIAITDPASHRIAGIGQLQKTGAEIIIVVSGSGSIGFNRIDRHGVLCTDRSSIETIDNCHKIILVGIEDHGFGRNTVNTLS